MCCFKTSYNTTKVQWIFFFFILKDWIKATNQSCNYKTNSENTSPQYLGDFFVLTSWHFGTLTVWHKSAHYFSMNELNCGTHLRCTLLSINRRTDSFVEFRDPMLHTEFRRKITWSLVNFFTRLLNIWWKDWSHGTKLFNSW